MAYGRGNQRNIIVGAAAFFVAPGGTALPAKVDGTPMIDTLAGDPDWQGPPTSDGGTDYAGAGFTSEGVEVSYEPDYGDVEVDQLLDSARLFKQNMRVMVNTSLVEATLENLLVVWGQPDDSLAAGVLNIEPGDLGDAPFERSLAFVGPAPDSGAGALKKERVYHVTRAIQTESSSHALRRNEATMFPVSFRVLPDTSVAGSLYGTLRDVAVGTAV